jgi:hypothetical protein
MPCPAAPPTRKWVQADQISADRASPGRKVDVRLNSVPARDTLGRIAHVRGIYLQATGIFSTDRQNDPVSAHQLRGLFQSIFLQDVSGHTYLPSIDGRDLGDDVYFRHWSRIQLPVLFAGRQTPGLLTPDTFAQFPYTPDKVQDYGIPQAFVSAGPSFGVPLSIYFPFSTLGPGLNPLAGLIPLAALQRSSNQGSFRFSVLSQIPGNPSGVNFLSLTDENGEPGMSVWLDIVYLPALAVDPAWVLDRYTLPELRSGVLRNPEDTTEHVWIYPHEEDKFDPNDLTGITLTVASSVEMTALTKNEALLRQALFSQERDSALVRMNYAQSLPSVSGAIPETGEPLVTGVLLLPYRQRGTGPASGAIEYKIANVGGTNTFLPFVHRTVSCNTADRAAAMAEAVSCDPCAKAVVTDAKGSPVGAGAMKNGTMLILDPKATGV